MTFSKRQMTSVYTTSNVIHINVKIRMSVVESVIDIDIICDIVCALGREIINIFHGASCEKIHSRGSGFTRLAE